MDYTLSTEELKQKFGDIYLEIISQKENIRTTCIRKSSDNVAVVYNNVIFYDEGVAVFGQEFHNQILSGKMLGQTIKNSGISHERLVSERFSIKINLGLSFLFDTKKNFCVSRKVDYKIKDLPYASITEFYNPEFTLVESGASESSEDLFTNTEGWFLIDQLKTGFEEEYLRLAHGFLKKPMHVGIEDQNTFVQKTRQTLELLMQDQSTKLFVAANDKQFIGYMAINIHPALHVNGLECVIRELYVREGYQGRGRGTALIGYVERYAKKRGCKRMSLATKWDDEKQKTFYESVGFSRRCDFAIKNLQ
ncbi:MAG: GNAT family N-acetyltransferase [Patescibacteria group bacterium]